MGQKKISNLHIVTDIKVKMSKLIFIGLCLIVLAYGKPIGEDAVAPESHDDGKPAAETGVAVVSTEAEKRDGAGGCCCCPCCECHHCCHHHHPHDCDQDCQHHCFDHGCHA